LPAPACRSTRRPAAWPHTIVSKAAEKLAKGLLVAASVPFRKTHDMDELADLAASSYPECWDLLDAVRMLTL
jgi:hypothetical protein